MIAPWIARSQYALTPRNVSAGPMAASSTTPSTVPVTLPVPPATDGAADDDRRDHLHLQADAGVARNLVEADRVEHGGQPGQRAERRRTPHFTADVFEAGQPRGAGFEPVA